MIVAAFALTPFAYGASVAFGVIAFAIGIVGLLFFATARPWRSPTPGSQRTQSAVSAIRKSLLRCGIWKKFPGK